MAIINWNLKNLKPNKKTIKEAVITGFIASLVVFILNFFGLIEFFKWIPDGFELFAIVFASVWIRKVFEVKI